MMIRKLIGVLLRAAHDPVYRREVRGRLQQKIDNGTLFSWIIGGIKRRVWRQKQLSFSSFGHSSQADTAQAYIQAIRFNQAPHPQFHLPRTRFSQLSVGQGSSPKFLAYYLPQFHPFIELM